MIFLITHVYVNYSFRHFSVRFISNQMLIILMTNYLRLKLGHKHLIIFKWTVKSYTEANSSHIPKLTVFNMNTYGNRMFLN